MACYAPIFVFIYRFDGRCRLAVQTPSTTPASSMCAKTVSDFNRSTTCVCICAAHVLLQSSLLSRMSASALRLAGTVKYAHKQREGGGEFPIRVR